MILLLRHDSLCQGHHVRLCIPCASPGRPRPTLDKPVESVRLAPARLSSSLPFLSFQSLTNCPICKPFVLTFIQNAGGVGGTTPVLVSQQLCFTSANLCVLGVSALSLSGLFHQSRVTNHQLVPSFEGPRLSNFSAAPNSSPFQSLLTNKNRLCYTEPVLGKLAS